MLVDRYNRHITDLRLSVTDRCNFRCVYCRSAQPEHLPDLNGGLLTWAELDRIARIFVRLGIRKIRVTGGEPLVRPGVVDFIARLRELEDLEDLSMTTNGFGLARMARALKEAGLHRVNVSLDSVHPEKFRRITRTDGFAEVMAGIEAAQQAGLQPVKVNAVVVRGLNDDEIVAFGRFARERGVVMRFIEFMPLDADRIWGRGLVVTAAEIREQLETIAPLVPLSQEVKSETALKFRFADGLGEIGLIAPVSMPFCGFCSRIRLTADGKIRTCLFSLFEHDVRRLLRNGESDEDIADWIQRLVEHKEEGHHINDSDFVQPERTMVFIGG